MSNGERRAPRYSDVVGTDEAAKFTENERAGARRAAGRRLGKSLATTAEGATTVLEIPAPAAMLSANDRRYRFADATLVKTWRTYAATLAKVHRVPSFTRVHVVVTIAWPDKRHRDISNYAPTVKACIDGLVDAGRLPADDCDCYVVGPDLRRGPHRPELSAPLLHFELTEVAA